MDDLKNTLIAARAMIERGWSQRSTALGRRGLGVDQHSSEGVRWCMPGAIFAVGGGNSDIEMLAQIVQELGYTSVISFNDAPLQTKAHVLAVFDAAITLLDSKHLPPAARRDQLPAAVWPTVEADDRELAAVD